MSGETPEKARLAPLNIKALLAEAAGGIAVGLLLSRVGGYAGAAMVRGNAEGFGDLVAAILLAYAGYIVGVAGGMALAGRMLRQHGSFWLALLGSFLGGVLVLLLAEPLRLNQSTTILSFAIFFASLPLALVGYNLRRARP